MIVLSFAGEAVYGCVIHAAWLAQLVERRTAVREVEGQSSPRPDQLRRMCCLCNEIRKWLDVLVFSDKGDKQ